MSIAEETAPVFPVPKATTTAAKIRVLASAGMTKDQIALVLGIRYQWVYNVLNTPLKSKTSAAA